MFKPSNKHNSIIHHSIPKPQRRHNRARRNLSSDEDRSSSSSRSPHRDDVENRKENNGHGSASGGGVPKEYSPNNQKHANGKMRQSHHQSPVKLAPGFSPARERSAMNNLGASPSSMFGMHKIPENL